MPSRLDRPPIPRRATAALAIALMLGVGSMSTSAGAALIAEENFDYGPTDVALQDQSGGTGWSANWDNVNANTSYDADLNITPTVAGYSNAGNVGGSATINSGSSDTNIHVREFSTAATTVWFSAAVNTTDGDERVILWIDATEAQPNSQDFVGVDGGAFFYRFDNDTEAGDPGTAGEATPVGSFLLVAKAEVNVSGTADRLSFWLAPSDVTSEAALGTATFVDPSTVDSFGNSIDGIAIQFFSSSADPGSIDAIRVGTTLADVTGFVIPEPASVALVGAGGLILLGRRCPPSTL